jgi:pimeloyl-ACP methyl ester carboxylesterase
MPFPAPRRLSLPARRTRGGDEVPPIQLSVHEAGSGPAVVLCHGFPELAYSWRHQFGALVAAGFRVIAPDGRGYGGSDRPEPIRAYDIHHLCSDLVGLLDVLGIERAVFAGHDWGGFVVWAMPILHPDRTAGVIGVNTPYLPRSPIPPLQLFRALVGGKIERHYITWFQEPGVAEGVLDIRVRLVFEKLMRRGVDEATLQKRLLADSEGPDMNPFRRLEQVETLGKELLTPAELETYVSTFTRTGFRGGINWYRNFDRNWETAPEVGVAKVELPCLMVTAQWDWALRPEFAAGMPALVADLELQQIAECGHWTQQEKPAELNRILADWLSRRFGSA